MKIPEALKLPGDHKSHRLGKSLTIVHISWND